MQASPILEQFSAIALAKNVHEFMRSSLLQGGVFPTSDIKAELLPTIPTAIEEKLNQLENRQDWTQPWTPLDEACLTHRLNKFKSAFQSQSNQ